MFSGGRLSLNDIASTEILFGVSQDLDDSNSRSAVIEASTRLGDTMRLIAELYHFRSKRTDDPLYSIRRDSYVELGLEYYF
jgi:predicted extracellular nuclease